MVGPHTFYALPGRMLIAGLSNAKDKAGGRRSSSTPTTASFLATHWMPTEADPQRRQGEKAADGYGYDLARPAASSKSC